MDEDNDFNINNSEVSTKPSLTSQLLLLYYLLLYEDTRLANSSAFISAGKHVLSYSSEFMSELPIKYLLQQAQKDQSSYAGKKWNVSAIKKKKKMINFFF